MAQRPRPAYRRRSFFVKQAFQSRFALYPVAFFAAFLLGAGVYLHGFLQELLQYHLYLPHSRLANPWDEVWPVLGRVAAWGGGAFLLVLTLWVWRRFTGLRTDLDRLSDWVAALDRGAPVVPPPALADSEVASLARGLHTAAASFEAWDRRVEEGASGVARAAEAAAETPTPANLEALRSQWAEVQQTLVRVRVHEEFS